MQDDYASEAFLVLVAAIIVAGCVGAFVLYKQEGQTMAAARDGALRPRFAKTTIVYAPLVAQDR